MIANFRFLKFELIVLVTFKVSVQLFNITMTNLWFVASFDACPPSKTVQILLLPSFSTEAVGTRDKG